MMKNLLAPYEQRPWAQTNWILVRLWRVSLAVENPQHTKQAIQFSPWLWRAPGSGGPLAPGGPWLRRAPVYCSTHVPWLLSCRVVGSATGTPASLTC